MRLLKTQRGIYINTAYIIDIYTSGRTIIVMEPENFEAYVGEYESQEALEFAFSDLIRRLTEDHKLIEIMTEEQAQAELERRKEK